VPRVVRTGEATPGGGTKESALQAGILEALGEKEGIMMIRMYCAIIKNQHLYTFLACNPEHAHDCFKMQKDAYDMQRLLYSLWVEDGRELYEHDELPEWAN